MCDSNKILLTKHEIYELLKDSDCDVFSDKEFLVLKGNVAVFSDSDSDTDVSEDLVLDNSSMSTECNINNDENTLGSMLIQGAAA